MVERSPFPPRAKTSPLKASTFVTKERSKWQLCFLSTGRSVENFAKWPISFLLYESASLCSLQGKQALPGGRFDSCAALFITKINNLAMGVGRGRERVRGKELICLVGASNISSWPVSGSRTFSNPDRRHYCLIRNETNGVCACRLAAGRRARVAISIVLPR